MTITLTMQELIMGAVAGAMRHISALMKGLTHKYGMTANGWTEHIEGALGEICVARALNIYWSPTCDTFKSRADIGKRIEVRTRSKDTYDLLVRPDDPDASAYVHVTGMAPTYTIHGWLRGADAKRDIWLQAYGQRDPAYFIPAVNLRPMTELLLHEKTT